MAFAPIFFGVPAASTGALIVDGNGSINAQVGSTSSVAIACNQYVSTLTLAFTVETLGKVDVGTVADASITKDSKTATLSLISAMTSVERTLRWSLTNTSTGEAVASGLMFVTYDAQGDS